MDDAFGLHDATWRQLDDEWARTRESWRDSTTQHFGAQFFEPLRGEATTYRQALVTFLDTLRAAQQVARAR